MDLEKQPEKVKENKTKYKMRIAIVIIAAISTAIIGYIMFRGTYLETLEIGEEYVSIFWKNVKYMGITLIANFTFVYFCVYMTNRTIKKNLKAMLCFNNAKFELQDPLFGIDIGYFVFIEPFIEILLWYLIIFIIILTIYSAIYYITTFNLFFEGIEKKKLRDSKIVKHIIFLIRIIAIIFATFIFINAQNIETDKFMNLGTEDSSFYLYGAGFTDIIIKLWGYRLLSLAIIISVFKAIKHFNLGNRNKVILSICIVPIYLVILFLVLILFKIIFINSNELDKQYIQKNIEYTKNAYGINIDEINIKENETEQITYNDLKKYDDIIENIAIVNNELVLKDLQKSQTSKGYYSYSNTSISEYEIDDKNKLVYISPREINGSNVSYNAKTYEYTHGYGVILTSATDTKESGNLNHIQKNIVSNE